MAWKQNKGMKRLFKNDKVKVYSKMPMKHTGTLTHGILIIIINIPISSYY